MCLFAIIIPDQPLPPPTQCLTGRNCGDRVGGEHGDGEDSIATVTWVQLPVLWIHPFSHFCWQLFNYWIARLMKSAVEYASLSELKATKGKLK